MCAASGHELELLASDRCAQPGPPARAAAVVGRQRRTWPPASVCSSIRWGTSPLAAAKPVTVVPPKPLAEEARVDADSQRTPGPLKARAAAAEVPLSDSARSWSVPAPGSTAAGSSPSCAVSCCTTAAWLCRRAWNVGLDFSSCCTALGASSTANARDATRQQRRETAGAPGSRVDCPAQPIIALSAGLEIT